MDVASYQGEPDWRRVYDSGVRFAFSKVSEGTGYTNPTWPHNRRGMLALGEGFVPGVYHFLRSDADPVAQARYFVDKAGDLTRFAVALDVEPRSDVGSRPTAAQARAWVAEVKRLTGGHRVLGYYPRWWWDQTGRPELTFFDGLWQSHYVSGEGDPATLYARVPADWWTGFGGESVKILQFSSSASVPGISGRCDVNAYRGSLAQLKTLTLGPQEDDMPYGTLATGPAAQTPVAIPAGRATTFGVAADPSRVSVPEVKLRVAMHRKGGGTGWTVKEITLTAEQPTASLALPDQCDAIAVERGEVGAAVEVAWYTA